MELFGYDKEKNILFPVEIFDNGNCLKINSSESMISKNLHLYPNLLEELKKEKASMIGLIGEGKISFSDLETYIFNHYFDSAEDITKSILNNLNENSIDEILGREEFEGLGTYHKYFIKKIILDNLQELNIKYEKGKNKRKIENIIESSENAYELNNKIEEELRRSNHTKTNHGKFTKQEFKVLKQIENLPEIIDLGKGVTITDVTKNNIRWGIIYKKIVGAMPKEYSQKEKKEKAKEILEKDYNFYKKDLDKIAKIGDSFDVNIEDLNEEAIKLILYGSGYNDELGIQYLDEFLGLKIAMANTAQDEENEKDFWDGIIESRYDKNGLKRYFFKGTNQEKDNKYLQKYVDFKRKVDKVINTENFINELDFSIRQISGGKTLDNMIEKMGVLDQKEKEKIKYKTYEIFDKPLKSYDEILEFIKKATRETLKDKKKIINGFIFEPDEEEKIKSQMIDLGNGRKLCIVDGNIKFAREKSKILGATFCMVPEEKQNVKGEKGYGIRFYSNNPDIEIPKELKKKLELVKSKISDSLGSKIADSNIKYMPSRKDFGEGYVIGFKRTPDYVVKGDKDKIVQTFSSLFMEKDKVNNNYKNEHTKDEEDNVGSDNR